MIIYKVYRKDYQFKERNLLGVLAERRKDLRGKSELESGLRWALMTFGRSVKDKKLIFVVPKELETGNATRRFMEKGIYSKLEFLSVVRSYPFMRETPIWRHGTAPKEVEKRNSPSSRTREIVSYRWHYRFSVNPFEELRDPENLYVSPSYADALTSVMEGIKKRVRLISILGEPGTGKTTFIHLLRSSLGKKLKTALVSYPLKTFAEILENILEELGLEPPKESKETLLRQLHEYLLHAIAGDQALVVIIDEAQSLSQQLIGELGKLCDLERKLQIVFIGQPELERKLDLKELSEVRQKTEIKYRIKPLSWKESQEYIDHRLRLVGSSASEVFTPMAVLVIVAYARGIPRVINTLCDNALLEGYVSFTRMVGVNIICEAINKMEGPIPAKIIFAIIIRIIRIIRKCHSVALKVDLLWPRRYFPFLIFILVFFLDKIHFQLF